MKTSCNNNCGQERKCTCAPPWPDEQIESDYALLRDVLLSMFQCVALVTVVIILVGSAGYLAQIMGWLK